MYAKDELDACLFLIERCRQSLKNCITAQTEAFICTSGTSSEHNGLWLTKYNRENKMCAGTIPTKIPLVKTCVNTTAHSFSNNSNGLCDCLFFRSTNPATLLTYNGSCSGKMTKKNAEGLQNVSKVYFPISSAVQVTQSSDQHTNLSIQFCATHSWTVLLLLFFSSYENRFARVKRSLYPCEAHRTPKRERAQNSFWP